MIIKIASDNSIQFDIKISFLYDFKAKLTIFILLRKYSIQQITNKVQA
jgi:hypothetical protein